MGVRRSHGRYFTCDPTRRVVRDAGQNGQAHGGRSEVSVPLFRRVELGLARHPNPAEPLLSRILTSVAFVWESSHRSWLSLQNFRPRAYCLPRERSACEIRGSQNTASILPTTSPCVNQAGPSELTRGRNGIW